MYSTVTMLFRSPSRRTGHEVPRWVTEQRDNEKIDAAGAAMGDVRVTPQYMLELLAFTRAR